MKIKLNSSYNILISSHYNEILLINTDEDIRSIKGEGIEDLYEFISLLKEKKTLHRKDFHSFFSNKYDSEYIEDIINWLLDEKIFILEDFLYKEYTLFCPDKNIINLIKELSNEDNSSIKFISNLDKLEGVCTELLVVIHPFAGLKKIYSILDNFSLDNKVKLLYVDLYEKCINIGPLINFEMNTCSLECTITRRLNNSESFLDFQNFINEDFIYEKYFIDLKSYTLKSSILLLQNEIYKILYNEDTSLYSKIKKVDFRKFELEQWFIIKDYNSSIFKKNINIAFNG